jgi:hypothetical protein
MSVTLTYILIPTAYPEGQNSRPLSWTSSGKSLPRSSAGCYGSKTYYEVSVMLPEKKAQALGM